jgi:hypothetical protein
MAGKPKRRAMIAELEKRTRQRFDENEEGEHTPLDYVCDYIEDRGTLIGLAVDLSNKLGFAVSAPSITNYLRAEYTESESRLSESRARASHLLAEESITLLDVDAETMVEASQRRDRSKARQWLAGKWNREMYESQKGVNVAISIGGLHLDALRARQANTLPAAHVTVSEPTSKPALTDGSTVDAEVID